MAESTLLRVASGKALLSDNVNRSGNINVQVHEPGTIRGRVFHRLCELFAPPFAIN